MLPAQGQTPSRHPGELAPEQDDLPAAWQPLTPGGVAAFAHASGRRLAVVQSVVAILAAATWLAVLHLAIFPVLRQAADRLPEEGVIRGQMLSSPLTNSAILARSSRLAVIFDPNAQPAPPVRADFRLWFRPREYAVCSLFGCVVFRYPAHYEVAFNRKELGPALDAWIPVIDGAMTLVFLAVLFVVWLFLASVFFPIPWVVARYSDRALTVRGSWKLAGAALMPGALLLSAGLGSYGLGWISLVQLLVVGWVHLMLIWLYLVLAPLSLPRREVAETLLNPFTRPPTPTVVPPSSKPRNPFTPP